LNLNVLLSGSTCVGCDFLNSGLNMLKLGSLL
jgi:hypothetical protein